MGGAARCEGRCNALRWHMQRAVFFTPPLCLVCDMPPFSPSQSFSTLLSALFLSLFNFFSFFHQFLFFLSPAFSKKNAARCISPRSILLFTFLTDGVGRASLCMRGLMAFRLPGDSLQRPPAFHSPAFCRLYICSTLSASTGLSVVMKLIPQLVISAIVGISLTVHTLVVIPLARATFCQAGLLR